MSSCRSWGKIEQILRGHLTRGHRLFVVCSALSGASEQLHKLYELAASGPLGREQLDPLLSPYMELATKLGVSETWSSALLSGLLRSLERASEHRSAALRAEIVAYGELLSSSLGAQWLASQGLSPRWLDARDWLKTTSLGTCQTLEESYLSAACDIAPDPQLQRSLRGDLFVTQGYIARHHKGSTALLGRGGSDTSAAYFAVKLRASRLQIWSDVPGIFTAHPQRFPQARLLQQLSYEEAAALAARGAKALHPRCLGPLQRAGIPLEMGWTAQPEQPGTWISDETGQPGIKAISSRPVYLISMRRQTCWQPVGFMSRVARCFEDHRLSMDLVASAPGEIRATIDPAYSQDVEARLPTLLKALEKVCQVELRRNVAAISLVGHMVGHELHKLPLAALHQYPIHMSTYAPDGYHQGYVIDASVEGEWLALCHQALFGQEPTQPHFGPRWATLQAPSPRLAQAAPQPARLAT